MLVVPELETELQMQEKTATTQRELKMLRLARADLDGRVQRLEWAFKQNEIPECSYKQVGPAPLGLSCLVDLMVFRLH